MKFGERYADKAENILKAIEGRGNLRNKIKSVGKADGEDLVINHGRCQERIKNWVAHHLIPVEALQKNEVVQAAVAAGFDFNGAANGIPVSADKHNSGGHKGYNAKVFELIKAWSDKQGDKGFTLEDAKKFLETDLIPQLKEIVNKVEKIK